MWCVAIVLLFTTLLLSGCLGVVLCWCVAGMGGKGWRMAIVRRFTANLLSGCLCVVPCCCDAGLRKEMFRGDCTTIYNASAVRLPWCVCCVVVLLGWGSSWCVTIVLLFTALPLSSRLGVCAVLLCC